MGDRGRARWSASAFRLVATSLESSIVTLSLRHQRDTMSVLLQAYRAAVGCSSPSESRLRSAVGDRGLMNPRAILAAPGPDAGLSQREAGIGGGTATSALDGDADRASVKEDLARLAGEVKEEGDNLRALEQFLARAGKLLASLPSRWPIQGPLNSEFGRRASPWAASSDSTAASISVLRSARRSKRPRRAPWSSPGARPSTA
jgi:hypothetical protein